MCAAMPTQFKHRNLPHLLQQAREALMQHFRPVLAQEGLSVQQWRVLRTLHDSPSMDAAGLAGACGILAPSLTRMLRCLEQAGYLARAQSEQDLRRQVICLTEAGRMLVARLQPRIEAIYETLEARIGSNVLDTLYQQVDVMLTRLGADGVVTERDAP